MVRRLVVLLLLVTAAERRCVYGAPSPVVLASAARFRDAVGVNVHLQYQDTTYGDFARVSGALAYLGVHHIRDSALRRGPWGLDRFVALGRFGYRFDLFFNADLDRQLASVAALEQGAPGAVETVEGPNEVNNDPVAYAGRVGLTGAQAYQQALYARVHAAPYLRGRPVLNFTDYPDSFGRADAANAHTYARLGASPGRQMAHDLATATAALPPGRPAYITETGYATAPASASPDAVTPEIQADLTLVALLDAVRAGVRRTFLYELLDERSDAGPNGDPQNHYGLFDADGEPKPAARVLHTLLNLLPDTEAPVSSAPAPHVDARGAKTLLLRGKDTSVLIVWRESGAHQGAELFSVALALDRELERRSVDLLTSQLGPAALGRAWTVRLGRGPQVYLLRSRPA